MEGFERIDMKIECTVEEFKELLKPEPIFISSNEVKNNSEYIKGLKNAPEPDIVTL